MTDKDYEVGYGKPPKYTRFKKGQSGNPAGRPKGHRNLKTEIGEVFGDRVQVVVDGEKKMVSSLTAIMLRLREKALKGDMKAIQQSVTLYSAHVEGNDKGEELEALPKSEQEILKAALKDLTIKPDADEEERPAWDD